MTERHPTFAGLDPFLNELSSSSPTPGGGAVAGLLGALAASLAHMVSSLTVGKKKYADHEAAFQEAMPEMVDAMERFKKLMSEDVVVFDGYMNALRLPKATDEEKEARRRAIAQAATAAATVPLKTLELIQEIIPHVRLAASHGNRNAVSDAGMAAILMGAAARSAAMNVRINLGAMPSDEAEKLEAKLDAILDDVLARASRIETAVASDL